VLLARSADKLQALAAELTTVHKVSASVLAADLAEPGAAETVVRTLTERQRAIDILVNNAGFGTLAPFASEDPKQLMGMLEVNVVALTMLARYLLPAMLERRRGRILNVASTAAFQPGPLMAVYYASKAYVLSLSEALSEETRNSGVTVTCLCPGPTRTGFQDRAHMGNARLFQAAQVMSSADVARAGYEGMKAGRSLVIPGLMNRVGVQVVRLSPRWIPPKIVRRLHAER
jgi:uncharacterized protein